MMYFFPGLSFYYNVIVNIMKTYKIVYICLYLVWIIISLYLLIVPNKYDFLYILRETIGVDADGAVVIASCTRDDALPKASH